MITVKDFPDKQYATKEALHRDLLTHEKQLISIKRSQVYKSIEKMPLNLGFIDHKFLDLNAAKNIDVAEGMVLAVVNTTNYLDSHDDVHFPGLWKRSIDQNQGKLFYVENHTIKTGDIIVWPENIKSFTQMIPWDAVGKNYEGETEALIYAFNEKDIVHPAAAKVISERRKVENSVRMIYREIRLAVNSDDPDFEKQKAYFDETYDLVANKERVEETGFYWGIHEAQNFKESSLVLGGGSNDATANLYSTTEPGINHLQDEPAASTSSPKSENQFDLQKAINELKIVF